MDHLAESRHRILVPGKTFLVGEYLALSGGPSVVISTEPCFEFHWETSVVDSASGPSLHHPFHRDSPAGSFLNAIQFSTSLNGPHVEHTIKFKDPFSGAGGLGASTAEFAGAWVFRNWLLKSADWSFEGSLVAGQEDHRETIAPLWKSDRVGAAKFRDMLDAYKATMVKGSGADLVSQVAGGLAVWDARHDDMRRFQWPALWSMEGLCLSILLTGRKMPTHEHLAGLQPLDAGSESEMRSWVEDAVQALALEDAERLIASVRGFGKVLEDTGRVADHTRTLLHELADFAGVRAAKGCGAMGSDVILVIHDQTAKVTLSEFTKRHQLKLAATEKEICATGLRKEVVR